MEYSEYFKQICYQIGVNYNNFLPGELGKIYKILDTIYSEGYKDGKDSCGNEKDLANEE